MPLPRLTLRQVLDLKPCYEPERVTSLGAGFETMDALEMLDLPIPDEDRLALVLRPELLPATLLDRLAVRFAQSVLSRWPTEYAPDPSSIGSWLDRKLTDAPLAELHELRRLALDLSRRAYFESDRVSDPVPLRAISRIAYAAYHALVASIDDEAIRRAVVRVAFAATQACEILRPGVGAAEERQVQLRLTRVAVADWLSASSAVCL